MTMTTSPPSCAECHEIWEPKTPGTLCDTPGLLRDSCTLTSYANTKIAKKFDITPVLDNTKDYTKKLDTTCQQNSSQRINEDNKKYTAKADGARKTIEWTS